MIKDTNQKYNRELLETLSGIGLNENQSVVYLTILEMGPTTVWEIAKKTGIKRPTCYLVLDDLVFRGISQKVNDGRRTVFSVISPKQMFLRLEQRYNKFKNHINQLESLASKSSQKPKIRFFEGVEGVKQAYLSTLEQPKGGGLFVYGTAQVENQLGDFIADYLRQRIQKEIRAWAIVPDSLENKKIPERDAKELRNTRFLSQDKFKPNLEVNIFRDTVIYIAHSEQEPFATVIENATIAEHEKQIFKMLWDVAQNPKF